MVAEGQGDMGRQATSDDDRSAPRPSLRLLAAVFFVSFSVIALEIALSRLLSVLFSYHYSFMILSGALIGMGAGAVLVHRAAAPAARRPILSARGCAACFSLAVWIAALLLVLAARADGLPQSPLYYGLLLVVPFAFAGMVLAQVYRDHAGAGPRLYGVDLTGAAAGAVAAVVVLNVLGGRNAPLLVAVTAAVGAVLLPREVGRAGGAGRRASWAALVLAVFVLGTGVAGRFPDVPVGKSAAKEMHDSLFGVSLRGEIVETTWSAFGRTDLVRYRGYDEHMDFYLDGTAGSPMYRFSGNVTNPEPAIRHLMETFPGFFPLAHLREEEKGKALIIGPGGGRDILLALLAGVREITAVEVNADLLAMARRYADYNGGIFSAHPNVKVVADEGRSFIRRDRGQYDLIYLSLAVTNTSRSLDGYALTENFLFTVEAMEDYLARLTSRGHLVIVGHDDVETLRLLSVALTALSRRGLSVGAAMKHLYVVASDAYLALTLRTRPFDPAEAAVLYESIARLGYEAGSSYVPYGSRFGPLNPSLLALDAGTLSLDALTARVARRGYDISPVGDDSPFFFKLEHGLPRAVWLVFGAAVLALALTIAVPLVLLGTRTRGMAGERSALGAPLARSIVLFAALGIGFMSLELALLQRITLFLGQPVMSLAALLSVLLAGAGAGSFFSAHARNDRVDRWLAVVPGLIGVTAALYAFLVPVLFASLQGQALALRLVVVAVVLAPLAFLLGVPFPLGLRLAKAEGLDDRIPWMWGISGVASVVGSSLTLILAMSLGFRTVLLAGAGCYLSLCLLFARGPARKG